MQVKNLAPDTPQLDSLLRQAKADLKQEKRDGVYKILGLTSSASQDDIKKAYKRMALKLREPSAISPLFQSGHDTKNGRHVSSIALMSGRPHLPKSLCYFVVNRWRGAVSSCETASVLIQIRTRSRRRSARRQRLNSKS